MPGTSSVIKGLTTLAREGTQEGTRAFKELAEWVTKQRFKQEAPEVAAEIASFKKDPAKVFMAERQTGRRIGPTPNIVPPKGFSFGGTDPMMTRSPRLVEARKVQEGIYSQFKPVGSSARSKGLSANPESVTALEDLSSVTKQEGSRVTPRLSGKWSGHLPSSRTKYEPGVRDAVRRDASGKGTLWEQTKELSLKYPNVKIETINSWLKGEGGKRSKP